MAKEFENHIVQYPKEYSLCLGCQSCDLVCSLTHDGVTGPTHGRIKLEEPDFKHNYFHVLSCMQCTDHPCFNACPPKIAAMCLDEEKNIAYIDETKCIGCGACARACKYTPSRIIIDKASRKAKKCDLCRNRPEGPACVQYCPVKALGLSEDPDPMKKEEK